jgi:hypothetical protein
MKRNQLLVFALMLTCFPGYAAAQLWAGVLDPGRAVDWSNVGMPGGIPNRTTKCATLNPGATAAQINSAIASCPSGQVVFLNAGNYNLSAGIDFANHSNVTLRGAGADQTFVAFTGGTGCEGQWSDVCFENGETNWPGGPVHSANWTAGYAKGTTVITLGSSSGLAVGNILVLDQLNDSSDPSNIFVCDTQGSGSGQCADEGPSAGQRTNRDQQQIVTVTAINGTQVTFSPALYMPNWRSSQSPGAWWSNTVIKNSGIEDMTLNHTNSSIDNSGAGVAILNALNCWVRGVRSIDSPRSHVRLYIASGIVIRDSYFFGTRNAVSQSYGIEWYPGGDSLVENNIFEKVTSPFMVNSSSSGSVAAYNYTFNDYETASSNTLYGSVWLHSGGIDNILFEGNVGAAFFGDSIHGTHHFVTLFRNYYNGWETGKNQQTTPLLLWTYSRYTNAIGNVLGKTGYHTNYECSVNACNAGGTRDVSIYGLGQMSNNNAPDANVKTTLMRWGNYDTVNGAVQWNASEVPSGLAKYPNPVPGNHNLPVSFYLSAKPNWWGSMPWPAAGPDVTGGADPSGHAYANPAQVCYNNGSRDGNGILIFNADNCYVSGQGIAPPTNVKSVVH